MTRSVAEVIGWTFKYDHTDPRGERWGHWYHEAERVPGGWPAHCYSTDAVPPQHTADDLLAWLRERDVAVWPGRTPYDDSQALTDVPVFLCVKRGFDETLCMDPAPTLLAALERAVLAVAGET